MNDPLNYEPLIFKGLFKNDVTRLSYSHKLKKEVIHKEG